MSSSSLRLPPSRAVVSRNFGDFSLRRSDSPVFSLRRLFAAVHFLESAAVVLALLSAMLSLFQCWLILFGCIISEVTGSVCLKLSNQYQHLLPSIFMFVCFAVAMAGFPYALSRIDLGTAYAVWSGIGTAATAIIGIFYFKEKATPLKISGVVVIILGVIMLNISEANEEHDTKGGGQVVTERSTLMVSVDGSTSNGAV